MSQSFTPVAGTDNNLRILPPGMHGKRLGKSAITTEHKLGWHGSHGWPPQVAIKKAQTTPLLSG